MQQAAALGSDAGILRCLRVERRALPLCRAAVNLTGSSKALCVRSSCKYFADVSRIGALWHTYTVGDPGVFKWVLEERGWQRKAESRFHTPEGLA